MNKLTKENHYSKEVGYKLSLLRKDLQISQKDLGKRLNKPQSYISKIELGERQISLFELDEYLTKLNMTLKDFIDDLITIRKN